MAKTVLKKTHQEAVVKLSDAGTYAIDLAADITAAGQVLTPSGTPKANIVGFHVIASTGAPIVVSRNSVKVLTLAGPIVDAAQFNDMGFTDNVENDSDIDVVITGDAQLYLVLRKVDGFSTTVEIEQFSVYDNPAVAGS